MAIIDILVTLVNFLSFILSSLVSLLEFISLYILDLPVLLMNIFNGLPQFMQTGISIVLSCIVVSFVLKLIKLVNDAKNVV